jgi:hypothetical protein
MKRIRYLIKEPGKKPRLAEISSDYFMEAKRIVAGPTQGEEGGYIETTMFNERLTLIVNEDARMMKLPINFVFGDVMIRGTAVIVRLINRGSEAADMTDEDIAEGIRFFIEFENLKGRDVERCFMCDADIEGVEDHKCGTSR